MHLSNQYPYSIYKKGCFIDAICENVCYIFFTIYFYIQKSVYDKNKFAIYFGNTINAF